MSQNDYAILVGISRYIDTRLHPLDGPVGDVRLMHDWMVSPRGGNVPNNNVTIIVSDENSAVREGDDMPPVVEDFLEVFTKLMWDPVKESYIRHKGSRLFLYFSGHGFCEKYSNEAHAALYVANANRILNWNIYGTYLAKWVKGHGLFDEIVLIMDCCRDAELTKVPLVPPLPKATEIGTGSKVKLFELYAAERGGKTEERTIAARNNEIHGLLTHAFLDALDHAVPDETVICSGDIKGYLEERWDILCGDKPAPPPEIIVPSNGEIQFHRGPAADLIQHFKLERLSIGDKFEVVDHNFNVVASITIASGEARVDRIGSTITSFPINGGILAVPLPAGYNLAITYIGGDVIKRKFLTGDDNVEL